MTEARKKLAEYVLQAIQDLGEKKGTTVQKIVKYIKCNFISERSPVKKIHLVSIYKILGKAQRQGLVKEQKNKYLVLPADAEDFDSDPDDCGACGGAKKKAKRAKKSGCGGGAKRMKSRKAKRGGCGAGGGGGRKRRKRSKSGGGGCGKKRARARQRSKSGGCGGGGKKRRKFRRGGGGCGGGGVKRRSKRGGVGKRGGCGKKRRAKPKKPKCAGTLVPPMDNNCQHCGSRVAVRPVQRVNRRAVKVHRLSAAIKMGVKKMTMGRRR